MTFFIPLLLILLLAVSGSAQQQQAPAESPLFRASVSLVRVDAQVVDRRGRAIPDLAISDFEIFDEGQPQKIVHFGHEREPLDLLLLLDVSGSMHRFLEEMSRTAAAALEPLSSEDRVAVMVFARNAAVRQEFTSDPLSVQSRMREAVQDRGLGSGTAINAAIISAAQYLERQPVKGRRAVLIVTDNTSLNYKVPDEDVIRELNAADAVLNGILVGKQKHPDDLRRGSYANPDFTPSDVYKLAEQTGGELIEARKASESFAEIIERIRGRYSLAYDAPPSAAGAFRRIRVELAAAARRRYPDAVVRARAGYYAAR